MKRPSKHAFPAPKKPSSPKEIPPGKYWVGDTCYAVEDRDKWMQYHNTFPWEGGGLPSGKECNVVWAEDGSWFVSAITEYGDGVYEDREGRTYPVDTGQIGVIHDYFVDIVPFGMHLITFEQPFSVTYDAGVIIIGDISIDTNEQSESRNWWL